MNLLSFLLQACAPTGGGEGGEQQGGGMSMMLMIVAMIAIFYFFMIRPQQKKQKDLRKQRESMKAGDKVVTAGGIHGRIKEVTDTNMLIEIADGVKIRIEKASVFLSYEDAQQK
ncbi:MAG: preprotein translocase subunit YajC [Tannerella sp.]|jgi:preprotein translocase subunit YajC|nr:preprotein translocase subunit YajC [Tannerella sp.]